MTAHTRGVVQKKPRVGLSTLDRIGQQLAYTDWDTYNTMCDLADDDRYFTPRIRTEFLGRRKQFACITLKSLTLILNNGLPLGPEGNWE